MSGRSPRRTAPYHHGDLRRALIDVTVQLIREGGIEAVSIRGVAGRLGVTMGAPYHHFRDKDELLAAVAAQGFQRLREEVLHALAQTAGSTGAASLQQLGRAYIHFATRNAAEYSAMFLPQFRDRPRFPTLHEVGGDAFDLLVAFLRETLALETEPAMLQAVALWSRWHGFACLVNDAVLTSKPGLPPLDTLIEAVVAVP